MSCVSTLLLALALAGSLAAQSVVVPTNFANCEAPGTEFWALSPFSARRQLVLGARHLGPLVNHQLTGLAVRRNMGDSTASTGGQLYLEIWLSHPQVTVFGVSPSFASNRGPDHRRVFAGTVSVPDAPPSPSVPAPWASPFSLAVAFASPFRYSGGPLCIETLTLTAPPGGEPFGRLPWWPIDAVVEDLAGSAERLGQSCIADMPGQPAGADPQTLAVGSTAVLYLRGPRKLGGGVCGIGTSRSRFGPWSLPLDLGPLGAPGCQLLNDMSIFMPFNVLCFPEAPSGYTSVDLQVPLLPSAAGATLYAQWVMMDPGVNPLQLTLSNSLKATLGTQISPLDSYWVESGDPNAASGRLLPGRVPVLLMVRA